MDRVKFGHYKPVKGKLKKGQKPGVKGASAKKDPYKKF